MVAGKVADHQRPASRRKWIETRSRNERTRQDQVFAAAACRSGPCHAASLRILADGGGRRQRNRRGVEGSKRSTQNSRAEDISRIGIAAAAAPQQPEKRLRSCAGRQLHCRMTARTPLPYFV